MTATEQRRALIKLGWHLATLAKKLNCSETLIYHWLEEDGRTPLPVIAWIKTMVELHENNPPPAWRVKSSYKDDYIKGRG